MSQHADFIEYQGVLGKGLSSQLIARLGLTSDKGLSHFDSVLPDWYCKRQLLPYGSLLGARSDTVKAQTGHMAGMPVPPGVQIRPPFYEKWKRRVVFRIPATHEQQIKWVQFHEAQIGKPYDRSLILGFALGNSFGTPRDWRDPDSWICSEEAAAAGEAAGIIEPLYVGPASISPNSLAIALSNARGRRVTEYSGS